jgi:predicted acetyltransferase
VAVGENQWSYRNEEVALTDPHAYVDLMNERAAGRNLPDGWVRADEFWIVENDEVVGSLNVRHELNERLLQMGGHIGYSTHPSHRGRGIATFALKNGLAILANLGIAEALVTCAAENTASIRVIEKFHALRIEDCEFPGRPDLTRRRYLLPTSTETTLS